MACGSSQVDASAAEAVAGRRQLRTHKFLPHPQQTAHGHDTRWRTARPCQPSVDVDSTASTSATTTAFTAVLASPQNLEHQLRRLGTDFHLPPTPPTRSHASSSSHSIAATSPTNDGGGVHFAAEATVRRQLATPPDRSPPTPDVTPPQPANVAMRGPRSDKREGGYWLNRTATDSVGNEHGKSLGPSASTTAPRTGVRAPAVVGRGNVHSHALGVIFGHRIGSPEARHALHSREELIKFDGSRSSVNRSLGREEEVLERMQNITPRRPVQPQARGRHPVMDEVTARPTNAAKAARLMVLREAGRAPPSPPKDPIRKPERAPSAPLKRTKADGQATAIQRVASAPSRPTKDFQTTAPMRSSSNVVEVVLVDGPPQRQKTLRHVRKQSVLREPLSDEQDPMADRAGLNRSPRPPRVLRSTLSDVNSRHESCVSALSNKTSRSISSNRARREIWRSGAIPVVVVPERRSSRGPKSGEPSLRSMSSRRSRRTASADSAPVFERRCHQSRRHSESDRWEPTRDCPPAIPTRSSSLSAPTSRNVSRAPSVQSGSIRKGGDDQTRQVIAESKPVSQMDASGPSRREEAPVSPGVRETVVVVDGHEHGFDGYDECLSPRKFSSLDTPFSVVSMETCGTAPELSEAQAVHMFLHQNSSILMVNNSGRPSARRITRTRHRGDGGRAPETPPPRQQVHKLLEADSPLRNPRDPPQPPKCPPVILTAKERPPRQLDSMVKRALSRRRHSVDYDAARGPAGLLARTLSLGRHTGQEGGVWMERSCTYPRADETEGEKPPLDHRPQRPMRSLSVTARFASGGPAELRRSSTSPRRKQTPPPQPSQSRIGVWRSLSVGAERARGRFSIGSKLEEMQKLPQTIRERRREKRTQKLRVMISGPRDVRDGVGEVIRRGIERVKV